MANASKYIKSSRWIRALLLGAAAVLSLATPTSAPRAQNNNAIAWCGDHKADNCYNVWAWDLAAAEAIEPCTAAYQLTSGPTPYNPNGYEYNYSASEYPYTGCSVTQIFCNPGYIWDGVGHSCYMGYFTLTPFTPPEIGNCNCKAQSQPQLGEPIEIGNGNESEGETDYATADGRLRFTRTYNSADPSTNVIGANWQSNLYARRIEPLQALEPALPSGQLLQSSIYSDPNTACASGWAQIAAADPQFSGISATGYNPSTHWCQLSNGQNALVMSTATGAGYDTAGGPYGVVAQRADGAMYVFVCSAGTCTPNSDVSIRLTMSNSGYTLTDANDTVEQYSSGGALQSVTSRDGYQQNFSYGAGGLSSLGDSLGRNLSFSYNASGNLQSVTTPDGTFQYGYDSKGRLTSVTYPDASGRGYQYSNAQFPNALTGIVDESGQTYASISYDGQGRAVASSQGGFAASGGLGVDALAINYANPTSVQVTDALGTQRTFTYTMINNNPRITSVLGVACNHCGAAAAQSYDSAGYPQSSTDWNGNITNYSYDDRRGLELSRTEAVGTAQQRTISTIWDPSFSLPDEIDEPGRKTTFSYDGSGNKLTKTVKDTSSGASRTWTYSNYTAWGAPQTVVGPRVDVSQVTQISYYPVVSGDPKSGQVETVTDALGHTTIINSYDGSNRPLQITDPNGLTTTLSYSARGWLASRQVGSELTSYSYWPTGLLRQVSFPSGASLSYRYNAAHQLIQVQDQLGNRIAYTPDAMGNNVQVQVYDANGNQIQVHQRVYSALNQLYQDVGAYSGEVAQYSHDGNDNLTGITDPLGHSTGELYDALNRAVQVTDPNQGLSHYTYNALDQLTGVADPRSLPTTYTPDAFGNIGTVHSPDGGPASATYDADGNVLTRTDATGQTNQYQYDALDRLTQIILADGSSISFTYDQGSNGIGRLTGMSDPSGSTAWSYDSHGRVLGRVQNIGGARLVTQYSYDSNGRLQSQTLPSGAVIGYTWSNGQISALSLNGTAFLSGLVWQPFAGPKSWTFANGEAVSRSYDLDGRLTATAIESGIVYDAASRITGITQGNLSHASFSKVFGYDVLDRLISYADPSSGIAYNYDVDGNRSTQTTTPAQGSPLTSGYSLDPASNRLIQTGDDSDTLSFATPATYHYDGLGERVQKAAGGRTTVYAYDSGQQLAGEYDGGGNLINETVWLGDLPVAALQPTGLYYIHADHLNAPRQIDNAAGQAVWTWDTTSFGASPPNQDPNGTGSAFVYNLRYPGQYYDAESGIFYNLNRDYNPTTGRYIESDPIGLAGGSFSMYAYVGGNPLSFTDPNGTQAIPIVPIIPPAPGAPGAPIRIGPNTPIFGPNTDECLFGIGVYNCLIEPVLTPIVQACDGETSREECRQQCDATYETQVQVCKMFPSKKARQQCYSNAADLYAECLRNCK